MLDENGCDVYNTVQEMLQSTLAECFTYVENYTRRDTDMLHRQRVKLPDGSYRWVQGKTHDELNDAIVRVYVESGRIAEFMNVLTPAPKVRTNFKELGEKWFTTYKSGLKEMSKQDYRYQLDHLLYPYFADDTIQDIRLTDVQEFLNSHAGTAQSTLRKSVIVLDQLFQLAIRDELMDKNPIDKKLLKYPEAEVHERDALDQHVFDEIIAGIPKLSRVDDRRMLALFCFTGMRRGEVAGLRWEDIDFDNKLIHVSRNVTYPKNTPVIGTPKSKKGKRIVPLDDRLVEYLLPKERDGFVLGGDTPLNKSALRSMWKRIGSIIDLHGATFHVFRHTYATMLNNAGVDIKTIQSIMGHSDAAITMNVYTHTSNENVLDAGNKFATFTRSCVAQPTQSCTTPIREESSTFSQTL